MVQVGLVGYGLGGKVFHAPLIHLAEGLRLHTVCSRSPEKRGQAETDFSGISTCADFDALLANPDIDLVVLATPHDTHAPMAVQAMDAGKHLVTDKVMCLNEGEARQMIAASRRNNVLLSVFQNRRWDGDFLTLRKLLADGVLGEVYTIESNITAFGGPSRGWRAWQAQGGGRTRDWGAHLVDQALQLFGATVASVQADFQYRHPVDQSDVESTSSIRLAFRNEIRFEMELGSAWAFPKPRYQVRGKKGGFRKYGVDPQEAAMKLGTFGMPIPEDPTRYHLRVQDAGGLREMPVVPEAGRYRTYYDNIAQVLLHGADLLVKAEECLDAVRVIDAIFASAKQGQVVKLED